MDGKSASPTRCARRILSQHSGSKIRHYRHRAIIKILFELMEKLSDTYSIQQMDERLLPFSAVPRLQRLRSKPTLFQPDFLLWVLTNRKPLSGNRRTSNSLPL